MTSWLYNESVTIHPGHIWKVFGHLVEGRGPVGPAAVSGSGAMSPLLNATVLLPGMRGEGSNRREWESLFLSRPLM